VSGKPTINTNKTIKLATIFFIVQILLENFIKGFLLRPALGLATIVPKRKIMIFQQFRKITPSFAGFEQHYIVNR
jgi:hypothetical protein